MAKGADDGMTWLPYAIIIVFVAITGYFILND
nr:MAG TPA: mannose-6-phosphate receptor [Caudoviricetes sp.]